MTKQGAGNMVLASMLFLGVGMILARGWLNDFETFVKSKVSGGNNSSASASTQVPASTPISGFNNGSSGAPAAGAPSGGGSW